MKERMLFVSLLLMALLLPMNSHAQNKDFGMWFSAAADKKIGTKWNVGLEGEFRTRNNVKTADRWSFGIDGGYKITNWLKASAGYMLLFDNNEKNTYYDDPEEDVDEDTGEPYGYYGKVKKSAKYWGARHRFNVSLTGSVKLGRFELSLRERWQYTYRPEKTVSSRTKYTYLKDGTLSTTSNDNDPKTYKGKGKNVLRSRLTVEYNIPNCKVDPYVNVEAYNSWALEKTRYTVGANWKIAKIHVVDFYYRFQDVRHNDALDSDPDLHVIGLGYKYKF